MACGSFHLDPKVPESSCHLGTKDMTLDPRDMACGSFHLDPKEMALESLCPKEMTLDPRDMACGSFHLDPKEMALEETAPESLGTRALVPESLGYQSACA